jgi:endonuclease-3
MFSKYDTIEKLARARLSSIEKEINSINYHKTKAKHVKETAKIITTKGLIEEFEELIKLPGVGRKTANVYLVARKIGNHIGVDTHVHRISNKLGWSKAKVPKNVEEDLMKLFPKRYWNKINYILVTFGQTHGRSQKREDKRFKEIRKIKE